MINRIYFCLEESGEIEDTSYFDFELSGEPVEYGRVVGSELEFLDMCANALSIRRISSFIESPEEDGVWHGYSEGLEVFEALLTDLIYRLMSGEDYPNAKRLVWDMRLCELILRKAELRSEGFYIFM